MGGTDDLEYAQVLDRVREGSARALFYLQVIALRRAENVSLRIDLLNVVARHREEETRTFLSLLVVDSSQDPAVRIAALERLMKYQDDATFEVLKSAWLDPAPFEGRYHLCRAFGENGRPGGVPLLRGALAPERPPDIRCHAALGLGGFVGDAGVRAELKALALSDADPAVRQNAIRSLGRSTDPDVDGFLRDLAASGATDAETKRVAWALLQQRARNP
jgi:HEAT repeat protein